MNFALAESNADSGARVLLVEDDDLYAGLLGEYLGRSGCRVSRAMTLADARAAANGSRFDAVLLDASLPDGRGQALMAELRTLPDRPVILFVTGNGHIPAVVEAMRSGADDYILKDALPTEIVDCIRRHLLARAARESRPSGGPLASSFLGTGPAILTVHRLAELAARTSTTVLLSGETGTGKSYLARLIHEQSERHNSPFVTVDCAALSESLTESELFGHERGAFTGAVNRRVGAIESTGSGTLFFDEIADLSPAAQGKLLRVIEERRFRRVGGTAELPVHARIVAATRRDLASLVATGRFREDLYFRLTVLEITLPPLRERPQDVALLFGRFLHKHLGAEPPAELTSRLQTLLASHPFAGNVREVRNLAERLALLLHDESYVFDPADLGLNQVLQPVPFVVSSPEPSSARPFGPATEPSNDIGRALVSTGGRIGDAARNLGMSRHALRRRLKKLREAPVRGED